MALTEIDNKARRARERFDAQTVQQAIERLPRLSEDALRKVRSYEEQNKARASVLAAVDRELAKRASSPSEPATADSAKCPDTQSTTSWGWDNSPAQSARAAIDERVDRPYAESAPWLAPPTKDGDRDGNTRPPDPGPTGWEHVPTRSHFDPLRSAISRSRWQRIALAVGIAVVLLAIGIAAGKSGTVTKAKYDAVRADLTRARDDAQQARQDAAQAESKAQADAQGRLNAARAQDQAQLRQQQDAVTKQQTDAQAAQAAAQQQAQQNAAQKASLDQQQAAVDASSFSDGLYQVGKDIQSGRYHTNGGTNCYWAKLSSSDTSSYIDNNLQSGPQTVTIDSPYFKTDGCGTWTKVG